MITDCASGQQVDVRTQLAIQLAQYRPTARSNIQQDLLFVSAFEVEDPNIIHFHWEVLVGFNKRKVAQRCMVQQLNRGPDTTSLRHVTNPRNVEPMICAVVNAIGQQKFRRSLARRIKYTERKITAGLSTFEDRHKKSPYTNYDSRRKYELTHLETLRRRLDGFQRLQSIVDDN